MPPCSHGLPLTVPCILPHCPQTIMWLVYTFGHISGKYMSQGYAHSRHTCILPSTCADSCWGWGLQDTWS